ncbi:hypothetical protein BKA62DRAFT_671777 [Auriculariales sp. MPI-PUGE-AT-0066]|nr:hypothetical protein BKA62DRAFT_671777 [Auriculariales sp. MPI-PUGE-AT-0066]
MPASDGTAGALGSANGRAKFKRAAFLTAISIEEPSNDVIVEQIASTHRNFVRAHPLFNSPLVIKPHFTDALFRNTDVPGRGKGFVATRPIAAGTFIIREPPLLVGSSILDQQRAMQLDNLIARTMSKSTGVLCRVRTAATIRIPTMTGADGSVPFSLIARMVEHAPLETFAYLYEPDSDEVPLGARHLTFGSRLTRLEIGDPEVLRELLRGSNLENLKTLVFAPQRMMTVDPESYDGRVIGVVINLSQNLRNLRSFHVMEESTCSYIYELDGSLPQVRHVVLADCAATEPILSNTNVRQLQWLARNSASVFPNMESLSLCCSESFFACNDNDRSAEPHYHNSFSGSLPEKVFQLVESTMLRYFPNSLITIELCDIPAFARPAPGEPFGRIPRNELESVGASDSPL